jgi:predicted  nucleic acid-binding Zn-ribbon protein
VKLLEQLTPTRNRLAKRKEEQQDEVDEQRARLERAENRLKKTIQDLDIMQAEISPAM